VRVERGSGSKDLDSTYTYDNEGRNTGVQYPPTWNSGTSSWDNGPNRTITYDDMGRLSKLTNATTSTDIVSATTYNAMGQLLTMTGVGSAPSEARVYNSLGQMKELTMGSLHMEYNYPGSSSSPVNNGKINSEANVVSGETVTYTYDYLNRLATATSSDTPGWGQSFAYDGFGNLSTVSNIKGTVPTLSVTYDDETNRRTSDCADANGNLNAASACYGTVYSYDIANRIVGYGSYHYSYAPGNKRVWRGNSSISLDELTYYSAGGAKLVTYDLGTYYSALTATASGNYYEYFGGKLLKNSGGWVNQDRLGSIGKFFPYGQERPSATSDGTEKFATYFRDSETGLDYAQNRYHDPGEGRFMTPDPFDGSISLGNPGSWNRYTYVGGDPINRGDPSGLCDVIIGGITQSDNADFGNLAGKNTAIQAYPYAGGNPIGGIIDVAMLSPDDIEAQVAFQAIMAAAADPGAINIVAYSGGAGAFTIAYGMLTSEIQSRISSVTYLSPGANGPFDGWLPGTQPDTLGGLHFPTAIVKGAWILSNLTEMNTLEGYHSPIQTNCGHTDTACLLGAASTFLKNNKGNPCSSPAVYSRSKNSVKVTPGFGPHWNPQVGGTGGGSMGLTVYDYWAWQNNMYASAYFEWSSWMAPYWAMAGHGSFNYETAYRIFNPELAYPTQ
jgi:RHS repeat-associated protein